MEKITKEQIDKAVTKAGIKIGENTCDILLKNMENFSNVTKEIDEPILKNNLYYFTLMSTAFHMGIYALKESLYELFCEEQA